MFKSFPLTTGGTTYSRAHASSMSVARWVLYAAATLLLCLFRIGGLTHQSLWFDEGYTLSLVSTQGFKSFLQVFGSYTTSEHLQPLYYFVMFAWSRIAGTSDVALRLPSALFSIGSGLCLFAILRRLTKTGNLYALVGIGLFSVSGYSVFYAQEARPYACIQFCAFALLAAWLARVDSVSSSRIDSQTEASWRGDIWLTVACSLASLASIFGVVLVISLAAAELYARRNNLQTWFRIWLRPGMVAGSLTIAYGVFAKFAFPSVVANDIVSVKQPLWMNSVYAVFGMMFGTTIGPSTADLRSASKLHVVAHAWPVLIPAALVAAGLFWSMEQLATRSRGIPVAAKVCGLAAGIYAFLLIGGFGMIGHLNVLPRHGSALFALLTFTVAGCALSIPARQRRLRFVAPVLYVAIAGAFVLNCISIFRAIYSPDCRKDDYRAVARTLPRDATPTFLLSGQTELLQHYGLQMRSAVDVKPSDLGAYLRTNSRNAHRVRVVTNLFRNYRWDKANTVEASLRSAYACNREADYADFEVLSCSLTKASFSREGMRPQHAQ